jgi:hypothetical protein
MRGAVEAAKRGEAPIPRWMPIVPMLKTARERATSLGHRLTTFEVDDPLFPLESRIAECRRCERLAVIEMDEAPYLFGAAFRVACDMQ